MMSIFFLFILFSFLFLFEFPFWFLENVVLFVLFFGYCNCNAIKLYKSCMRHYILCIARAGSQQKSVTARYRNGGGGYRTQAGRQGSVPFISKAHILLAPHVRPRSTAITWRTPANRIRLSTNGNLFLSLFRSFFGCARFFMPCNKTKKSMNCDRQKKPTNRNSTKIQRGFLLYSQNIL